MKDKKFYYCDPEKNITCKKTHCAYIHTDGECRLTTNKEFAKNDEPVKDLNCNRENIS